MERLRELWDNYRYQILVLLFLLVVVVGWYLKGSSAPSSSSTPVSFTSSSQPLTASQSTISTASGRVCVDVKGVPLSIQVFINYGVDHVLMRPLQLPEEFYQQRI